MRGWRENDVARRCVGRCKVGCACGAEVRCTEAREGRAAGDLETASIASRGSRSYRCLQPMGSAKGGRKENAP